MDPQFDLVIRRGTIIDGSGGDPREGDVAVSGGKFAAIGSFSGAGVEEIDAKGCIVTPGFVDIHTHYDGQVTWENRLGPSSNHGTTTVVMGNCGVGFAPCRPDQHELVIRLMEGVEDIPGVVMAEGVPWNWTTFPEYMDALAQRETDVDFAAQLPHSPLRVFVMGERGADLEPPTEDDLRNMRRLTAEAIKAGALGVSTSRNLAHRFRSGQLAPSVSTEETEVLALAAGLRDAGTGVFQLVPNTDMTSEAQLDLLRKIAQTARRPVSFSFLQNPLHPDDWETILAGLVEANLQGLAIKGQVIPRPVGGLMGLELSFHPFSLNPSFRPIANLPLAEKVKAMRDPALRARLLSEAPDDPQPFFVSYVSDNEAIFVLGDPPNYHPSAEESIAAQARRKGLSPPEVIYDALLERDGHQILYRPIGNALGDRFESCGRNMVNTDVTVLGLGDGGAHYSMICDAAYPTYVLTYWTRDASPDKAFSLPLAIRKLTHETAAVVGLHDRGLIRLGAKADLNVIDYDRLALAAPHPTYDLPAGGRRLRQESRGYRATVLGGRVTYRDGQPTGALPGRFVRGPVVGG